MILGVLGIIFMIMLSQESKHAQRNRGQIIHETFNGAPFVTYKVSKIGGGTLTMQQVLEAAMNLGYELHAQSDSEHITELVFRRITSTPQHYAPSPAPHPWGQ